MAMRFENGVFGYRTAQATVTVYFPVNEKGVADICCHQCPYLSSNERMCLLNKRMVAYPQRYIGQECPLEEIKE